MPYNLKQYDPAKPFLRGFDDNIVDENDKNRVASYDLYEYIYLNSSNQLKLVLRGEDQVPLLMPSGRKIIEATHRFLAVDFDYFVEPVGNETARQAVEKYMHDWFKREAIRSKFTSNKRWGLVRGDAHFYIYAEPDKVSGQRVSIVELDPRQVFLIEEGATIVGVHIVESVQDLREADDSTKQVAARRTFMRERNEAGQFTGKITSELTHWTLGKWDDRTLKAEDLERVRDQRDQEIVYLPDPISQLPVYRWRNKPPQNSTWGTSQLEGLETLMYGINQSLTDEDATIVFQGLGMYVTNAAPPVNPDTGEITDWNIGPMQIIEIPGSATDQYFNRVSGVNDVSPYQDHMTFMDEKGLEEAAGTPSIAIGKVTDTSIPESGVALDFHMKPLLAANEEKEAEFLVILDQMFHDIVHMWLPAYERELFSVESVEELSVVTIFGDPLPKNKDTEIQTTLLLTTSHLILKSMAVAKLRELGWRFPEVDAAGNPLTDDDIVAMLQNEAEIAATTGLSAFDTGGQGSPGGDDDPDAGPDVRQVPLNVS